MFFANDDKLTIAIFLGTAIPLPLLFKLMLCIDKETI